MVFQVGEWVRTSTGITGELILLDRMSAFVLSWEGDTQLLSSHLLSGLVKADPPAEHRERIDVSNHAPVYASA